MTNPQTESASNGDEDRLTSGLSVSRPEVDAVADVRAMWYRRRLEHLTELCETFLHDLRTPMGVAMGRVELARETGEVRHLESAASALQRASATLDEWDADMDAERLAIDDRAVEFEGSVRSAWESHDADSATLVVESSTGIRADEDALDRLLMNLLTNAVAHGGRAVTVRVGVLDDGFYVEDDGPGIPDDERERVFVNGFSTSDDGSGIGLASVSLVADAHGWAVSATEGNDGGARFEVTGVETL